MEINGRPLEEKQPPLVFNFELVTMEVILENLLSNAMKHADHIEVEVAETNGAVQIAIIDHGSGFDVRGTAATAPGPGDHQELGSTQLGLRVTLHLLEKCAGLLLVSNKWRVTRKPDWVLPSSW